MYYLSERGHKQREQQAKREGETVFLLRRESDAGLDPRTLGSRPKLKADA